MERAKEAAMCGERRCLNCRERFSPRRQNPDQQSCGKPTCQRERRRRWQSEKQRSDADYRENKRRAQQAWAAKQPLYWREWREKHPEYCERNRAQQAERNRRPRSAMIAKTYASEADLPVASGVYRLLPGGSGVIAKKYAWTVKIDVIARPYVNGAEGGSGEGGGLQRRT
jgi:hypothetical protein